MTVDGRQLSCTNWYTGGPNNGEPQGASEDAVEIRQNNVHQTL